MYLQDVGGDENFHLYLQPLDGKPAKDLTAFEGVRAQNLVTDKHFPGEVVLHTSFPYCMMVTSVHLRRFLMCDRGSSVHAANHRARSQW